MADRWTAAQVEALAPDGSSLSAARGLARPGTWTGLGTAGGPPASVWGLCQGSGTRGAGPKGRGAGETKPYQTCVDLAEPAYRCSCPSRKFPCKHALGLLLLWSAGSVPEGEPPAWVREWHAARATRQTRRAPATPAERTPEQEKAAAQRASQRAERVAAGVAELDQWLADQVRGGIAGLNQVSYRHFDQVAARLVDAQAAGLASEVRRLAGTVMSGEGWPERLLGELGLLRLLTNGFRALDAVPEPLAHTIRARIGFTVPTQQVLAGPRRRDRWQVVGVRDDVDERLITRRCWLVGAGSGTPALVLSFAPAGQALEADFIPGTEVDADLCFYPGTPALRALVAQRYGPASPMGEPPAVGVRAALGQYAAALAGNPWLTQWPVLLRGTLVPGTPWRLVDAGGDALPLLPAEPWTLLAASGGAPFVLAAEWGPAGLRPLAGFVDGELIAA
jgi:hypothetical protein